MTYSKAEIRALGDASVIIQSLYKTEMIGQDVLDSTNPFATDASYDLDE